MGKNDVDMVTSNKSSINSQGDNGEKGFVKDGGFIDNRTRALRKLVRPIRDVDESKRSAGRIFGTILGAFKVILGKSEQKDDGLTIEDVENRWGITDSNRYTVIKAHYVEGVLFLLLGLFGIYQIYDGLFATDIKFFATSKIFGGILLCIVTLMRLTVLMWRADVLKQRRWITYQSWLRGK